MKSRARNAVLVAAVYALLSLVFVPQAYGYTLTGQHIGADLWYRPYVEFTAESREGMRQAMSTWNKYLPVGQRACFDNTSHYLTSYPQNDGLCRIYKTHLGDFNYVAQNTWWYNPATGATSSSDIDINANYSWANGAAPGRYDVQTIVLHEIGHSVGLDHSGNSNAVMYAYAYTNTTKRSLHSDDINGVQSIY